ncbi:hypothetical protein COJ85_14005 [Bacillus sp. AFS076308]|uniref:hypothetical protein n=1 Tax=Bacillus sp. AFS076308 TaxID=2033512 RepID=UPI000BF8A251|nr:hypothetical protein [Bacillus sp. AFS076308]PFO03751.1 hypothetical protein COJ85_14005 [Bacillus sp. AFS076308]
MTVLIGVAVKPRNGDKPYLIMGSDSKRVKYNMLENGTSTIIGVEEDYEKIFPVNNKLIAMTGMFPDDLTLKFLDFIKENDTQIEELTKIGFEFIKKRIIDSGFQVARCTVIIGSCENSEPKIGYIEVDNQDIDNAFSQVASTANENFTPIFSGSTENTEELQRNFVERVNKSDFNMTTVRKAAT